MKLLLLFLLFFTTSTLFSQKKETNLYLSEKEKSGFIKKETLIKIDTVTLKSKKIIILNKFELVTPLYTDTKEEKYYLITIEPEENPRLIGLLDLDETKALLKFAFSSNLENQNGSISFFSRYKNSVSLNYYKNMFHLTLGDWNETKKYIITKDEFIELAFYLKELLE